MFDEEKYYYNLASRLLDAYSFEEILYISETDPYDILAELIRSRQIILDLTDFKDLEDDEEET